jgi:hypothetical protein
MQQAEEHGDVATMERLAVREQASRDAFYMPSGLLQNAYYKTIDRVFTSLPEIAYAGSDQATLQTAQQRALVAVKTATYALASP